MQLTLNPQKLAMSSLEISEVVKSRHDSVKRTIERCAASEVFTLPPLVEASFKGSDGRGQTTSVYYLDKRSSIIVAAQLSPAYTAGIVDRWQELEELVARTPQAKPAALLSPTMQVLADNLTAAELLGVPLHLAQTEAVKATARLTGQDFKDLLALAPAQSGIRKEDEALEPTELGKLMGLSAVKCNQALSGAGLQIKSAEGWEPTSVGSSYAIRHHWTKAGKSGYNWKWKTSVIKLIEETK